MLETLYRIESRLPHLFLHLPEPVQILWFVERSSPPIAFEEAIQNCEDSTIQECREAQRFIQGLFRADQGAQLMAYLKRRYNWTSFARRISLPIHPKQLTHAHASLPAITIRLSYHKSYNLPFEIIGEIYFSDKVIPLDRLEMIARWIPRSDVESRRLHAEQIWKARNHHRQQINTMRDFLRVLQKKSFSPDNNASIIEQLSNELVEKGGYRVTQMDPMPGSLNELINESSFKDDETMLKLMALFNKDPDRIWTIAEILKEIPQSDQHPSTNYALHSLIHDGTIEWTVDNKFKKRLRTSRSSDA